MQGPAWWRSLGRMDAIFRLSQTVAIVAYTLGVAAWIAGFALVGVLCAIGGTTAILVMLFAWFRRDDLARGSG